MKTIPQNTLRFLDSWLELRSKWANIPGFVVTISKNDTIIFNNAYGYADIETKTNLTPDHVFRIASQSKTFTATAIMQLQEKGKIHIDDTAVKYIDWLNDHSDERWKTVTIRQLLSHSAGVIRDGLNADYWALKHDFPRADELRAAIMAADLVLEPNTQMKYSNYGFSLLGQVIETVSGESYDSYVQKNIIDALGLSSTSTDFDDTFNYTKSYSRRTIDNSHHVMPNPMTYAMAPATGASSTNADLTTYFSAHQTGTGLLLSDESKKEMQREQWPTSGAMYKTAYGLGFETITYSGRRMIGHGGGFPGFSTISLVDSKDKLVIIVSTNANCGVGDVANGIITIIDAMGSKEPSTELKKFQVRSANLWGITEIVATGTTLKNIWPNTWFPFSKTETLQVLDDVTLEIKKTDSFMSQGEEMVYTFNDDGSVHHIIDAGMYIEPSIDGDVPVTWK